MFVALTPMASMQFRQCALDDSSVDNLLIASSTKLEFFPEDEGGSGHRPQLPNRNLKFWRT